MKYNISDARYMNAVQEFLSEFEKEWESTVDSLGCRQKQLLIGNRLRPQIAFWGYISGIKVSDLNSISYKSIAQVTVSIELLHKASILLDDILDNDSERHGEKAFHIEYGEKFTIIFALHLVGVATWRLRKIILTNYNENMYDSCLEKILDIIYNMSLGALEELQLKSLELYDKTKIRAIAGLETAEIIGNSLQIGYIFSHTNNEQALAILKTIGLQCGYLFQTLNDLEAFSNAMQNMKHKGEANFDIDRNRKNIVITILWELASKKDKEIILHSTGKSLIYIAEKYHLKSFVLKEMGIVFNDMLEIVHTLSAYDISNEWIISFSDFLCQLRNIAFQRL